MLEIAEIGNTEALSNEYEGVFGGEACRSPDAAQTLPNFHIQAQKALPHGQVLAFRTQGHQALPHTFGGYLVRPDRGGLLVSCPSFHTLLSVAV